LLGDERIPTDSKGNPRTEDLRAIITRNGFTVNQKFRRPYQAHGSVRVILAANKPNLVSRGAELTADDIRALSDRFVYVQPHPYAVRWLADRGGPSLTERWVKGGAIAAHARWLFDAACSGLRPITRGSRLLVPPDSDELAQYLRASSGVRWSIMYWLVHYLRDPAIHQRATISRAPAAFVDRGALWVCPSRLAESWDNYLPNERPPNVQQTTAAVRALVTAERRVATRVRYMSVDLRALQAWCEEQGEPFPDLHDTAETTRAASPLN
jgi:hypothetical protein